MSLTSYELQFLRALAETVAIETVVLFLIVRFLYRTPSSALPNALLVFAGCTASFATLPYLWFVMPHLFGHSRLTFVVAGEALVAVLEGVFYCFVLRVSLVRGMVISLVCNAASLGLGLLIA